jgi:hypothetical protein
MTIGRDFGEIDLAPSAGLRTSGFSMGGFKMQARHDARA